MRKRDVLIILAEKLPRRGSETREHEAPYPEAHSIIAIDLLHIC